MRRIIPREKLGRKARKALDSARRAEWTIRPTTRRVESKKLYDRKKLTHDRYDDGMGPFLRCGLSTARRSRGIGVRRIDKRSRGH